MENSPPCCRCKHTPRDEETLRQLKNRLSRMIGQLEHLNTCVREQVLSGHDEVLSEALDLIKKLK